jgi:hypothetical protein
MREKTVECIKTDYESLFCKAELRALEWEYKYRLSLPDTAKQTPELMKLAWLIGERTHKEAHLVAERLLREFERGE